MRADVARPTTVMALLMGGKVHVLLRSAPSSYGPAPCAAACAEVETGNARE